MKKILAIFVMVLFAAYPAVSQASSAAHGAPVEISGTVVLQHIISDDLYDGKGDDSTSAYKVYLNFDKQITEGIKAHVIVNADQFGEGDATDSDALEEAQIIFTGIAGNDITFIAGKVEAPFGQDYSQFISSTETHHLEIDKVWGAAVAVGIESFGSVTAGVVQADPSEDRNTALTDSYAVKVKADKMIDGLSIEASLAKIGEDKDGLASHTNDTGHVHTTASVDEDRWSIGAKYTISDLTVAVEQTNIADKGGYENLDLSVLLFGVDYKIGNILLKANFEDVNEEDDVETIGSSVDTIIMYGANYEFTDGVYATIEAVTESYEDTAAGAEKDDESKILLGLSAHF